MFHSPHYLLLLSVIPWIAWLLLRRSRCSVEFSGTDTFADVPLTWRQRLAWLPPLMFLLAVVLLIVAMARPQVGRKQTVSQSEGIAIEMLVDRSGSMQAMDFEIDGEHVDRLTAIKNVASKFVTGSDELDGRFSDLIGLITFARRADGVTPPTLDHAFLVEQLNESQIVAERSEDGTAIGDAIGLAVEKLTALDHNKDHAIESKVAILLTDGENNAGAVDPIQAAELAATLGVKIYTIGVGTKGQAPIPVTDPFSGRRVFRWMNVNIDEKTLTKVAELTGGKYFRATDTESLRSIYKAIDELEKSEVEEKQYVDYREWGVESVQLGGFTMPPIVAVAFLLLAGRAVLVNSLFRRLA